MSHSRRSITRRSRPSPQAKVDQTLLTRFDRATLEEAKKIILGTSEWFGFDEAGKLSMFDRGIRPEDAREEAEKLALLREAASDPDAVRANIRRLVEQRRAIVGDPRIEVLRDQVDALEDDFSDEAMQQVEALMDQVRALEREPRLMRYRLGKQIGALKHALAVSGWDRNLMQFEKITTADLAEWQGHPHKPYLPLEAQHLMRLLEEGLALYEGEALQQKFSRVQTLLEPFDYWRRLELPMPRKEATPADPRYLSPLQQDMLAAAMLMLANSVPEVGEERLQRFNAQVEFHAHADDIRMLRNVPDAPLPWFYRTAPLEDKMTRMGEELQRFAEITVDPARARDEQEALEEEAAYDDEFADPTESLIYDDPHYILKTSLATARDIAGSEDYWRYHNSHPEVVNFIRASGEVEALQHRRGESQPIADAASFFGSPWRHILGGADITVNPVLLERARAELRGQNLGQGQ